MEGIQETIGFINEVRRLTREARDKSAVEEEKARKQRFYEAQVMREEAEAIAETEWSDLQNAIREVAADGGSELSWGIPTFKEYEKEHYYAIHMMDILKEHGFTVESNPSCILVKW